MKKTLQSLLLGASLSIGGCATTTTPVVTPKKQVKKTPATTATYDYTTNRVRDLSLITQCAYRLQTLTTYSLKGTQKRVPYTYRGGLGTALPIAQDRRNIYFLTAAHVVDPADMAKVMLRERTTLNDLIQKYRKQMQKELGHEIPHPGISLTQTGVKTILRTKLGEEKHVDIIAESKKLDIALVMVARKHMKVQRVCTPVGNEWDLKFGNVLYTYGYGGWIRGGTKGIYSGNVGYTHITDARIVGGHSGSGVFALRNGVPELVGITVLAYMDKKTRSKAYGGFQGIQRIRKWLATMNLEHLLKKK